MADVDAEFGEVCLDENCHSTKCQDNDGRSASVMYQGANRSGTAAQKKACHSPNAKIAHKTHGMLTD